MYIEGTSKSILSWYNLKSEASISAGMFIALKHIEKLYMSNTQCEMILVY